MNGSTSMSPSTAGLSPNISMGRSKTAREKWRLRYIYRVSNRDRHEFQARLLESYGNPVVKLPSDDTTGLEEAPGKFMQVQIWSHNENCQFKNVAPIPIDNPFRDKPFVNPFIKAPFKYNNVRFFPQNISAGFQIQKCGLPENGEQVDQVQGL